MKKNKRKAILFSCLSLLAGLIINVMYHVFMDGFGDIFDGFGSSFDWLEPFRFGYVLFPLMLLLDVLLLVLTAAKKTPGKSAPEGRSVSGMMEICVFSLYTVLTALIAVLTAKAMKMDTGFYSPFLVKAAVMALAYLLGTFALVRHAPRFGRAVFLASAVLCVLGAGFMCRNLITLFSAVLGGWKLIPSMILLLLVECGPLTLRSLSLAGWMGRREK